MEGYFEIKSYRQLQFFLGGANVSLGVAFLLVLYFSVLSERHRVALDALIGQMSSSKIIALVPLALISLVWAWTATEILRLHDKIHEPIIRKWRAGYDSDFILRSLLNDYSYKVPPEFYERAYADRRVRAKFMQRLFYDFVGDETKAAEGRRLFIYSELAKYWTMALLEIYTSLALLLFAGYAWRSNTALAPWLVISLTLLCLAARVYGNGALDAIHAITIDQISTIRADHSEKLEKALKDLLDEQGMHA